MNKSLLVTQVGYGLLGHISLNPILFARRLKAGHDHDNSTTLQFAGLPHLRGFRVDVAVLCRTQDSHALSADLYARDAAGRIEH